MALANVELAHAAALRHRMLPTLDTDQDCCLAFCLAVRDYDPDRAALSTFAYAVIRHALINHWRCELRWREIWKVADLDDIGVDHDWPDLDADASNGLLAELLRFLKDRHRRIIIARYLEGKTLEVVAKELRITGERVRQIEMKAMRRLQEEAKRFATYP